MPRRALRAVLAAISLLVLGGVLGITLDRWMLAQPGREAGGPVDAQVEMVEALQEELALTSTQASAITAILEQYQGRVTHTWETMRPNLRATMDSVGSAIERVLTPEQREPFRRWIREQHGPNGSMSRGPVH